MADWQAIRQEYEAGASLRTLAARHSISKSTIERHAKMGQWDSQAGQRDTQQASIDANSTPEKEEDLSTIDTQRRFLEAYSQHANVTLSAREAGIHRTTVYDWLEKDEAFSFAFNHAKEEAKDAIRAEIYRRGAEGYYEQVMVGGKVQTLHKYSDTLLIFHAKMLMPEYREKQTIDVNTTNKTVEIYRVRIPHNDRD